MKLATLLLGLAILLASVVAAAAAKDPCGTTKDHYYAVNTDRRHRDGGTMDKYNARTNKVVAWSSLKSFQKRFPRCRIAE